MAKRMIKIWNMEEESFNKAIEAVRRGTAGEDFLGNLYMGDLDIEFKLLGEPAVITFDIYEGGKDTGYGYTEKGHIPYTYADGGVLCDENNIDSFSSFEAFKGIAEWRVLDFIKDNPFLKGKARVDKISMDWVPERLVKEHSELFHENVKANDFKSALEELKTDLSSPQKKEPCVYLNGKRDGTWVAGTSKLEDSILFVEEGKYPANLYYSKTDINGSSSLEAEEIKNRFELISTLNWCGICGFPVVELWEFDLDKTENEKVLGLFSSSLDRRRGIIEGLLLDEGNKSVDELIEEGKVSLEIKDKAAKFTEKGIER